MPIGSGGRRKWSLGGRGILAAFLALAALAGSAFPASLRPSAGRAGEEDKPHPGLFSLWVENDLFAGTDRRYTSGFGVQWISGELSRGPARVPRWVDALSRELAGPGERNARRFVSLALAQEMYTPEDITRSDVILGDRPYAGYTYLRLGFHALRPGSLDTVGLTVGLVGPHSLTGATQILWHKIFGFLTPEGWDHQLKDELILGLHYDHRRRVISWGRDGRWGGDAVLHLGGSLSNAVTQATVGAHWRWGLNMPRDFGAASLRPGEDASLLIDERGAVRPAGGGWGGHVFLALQGHAVARDIFLDGNLFADSPRVEKYPFRGELIAGVAVHVGRYKASLGYVIASRQFRTERKRGHVYGVFNLSAALGR